MNGTAFVMPCCGEPTLQIAWALAHLRQHHPNSPVVLAVDGPLVDRFETLAQHFNTSVVSMAPAPLKRIEHGGKWLHKVFETALQSCGDFDRLIKLDPDMLVDAPVAPPDGAYAGRSVARRVEGNPPVVCHAIVAFARSLVDQAWGGGHLLDPALCGARSAVCYGSPVVSEEIVMARVVAKLGAVPVDWPEVEPSVHMQARDPRGIMRYLHPTVPYMPGKFVGFTPAAWYRDMLEAEKNWLMGVITSRHCFLTQAP